MTQAADDAVALIVMTGEGSKAFCAGGDVVAVVKSGRGGDDGGAMARDFFREEYILDHILATMEETPYVAIMDGITMGGGVVRVQQLGTPNFYYFISFCFSVHFLVLFLVSSRTLMEVVLGGPTHHHQCPLSRLHFAIEYMLTCANPMTRNNTGFVGSCRLQGCDGKDALCTGTLSHRHLLKTDRTLMGGVTPLN